jgi:hypothetical protein
MNFVEKLELSVDLDKIKQDMNDLLTTYYWPEKDPIKDLPGNQIGLNYREGAANTYFDAVGSLYDKHTKTFIGKESDFVHYNDSVGEYTRSAIDKLRLVENCKFGRIRYMRLMPKTGLSIHSDLEIRYHLAIETNSGSLIGEQVQEENLAAKCYHIPADGHFYRVDTTRPHFVYNGGWEPRIHLVICKAD